MIIGIDGRCLEEERISGVGEYALELLKNLMETDQSNRYVIFSNSFKQANRNFSWLEKYPNAQLKRFRYPNKILNLSLWYLGWPKLDKMTGKIDLFFAPNINFLALSLECPLVLTFHDLSFERYPEYFSRKTRLWHYYFVNPRKLAGLARRIIAVSESTRKDLADIYKTSEEKISKVYHGVGKDYRLISRNDPKLLEIQKKYGLPYKFILHLGNIEPRKNISSLLRAYEIFRNKNAEMENYKLVLIGQAGSKSRDLLEEIEASPYRGDIFTTGYVEREDKPYLYNLAALSAYPSHFEGFGLPVVEAIACGTPVITSNSSSLPEVADQAAILVNPDRPDEIARAIESILKDEKLRNEMRERGLARAKKFNWKKSAQETIKIFETLHANRN